MRSHPYQALITTLTLALFAIVLYCSSLQADDYCPLMGWEDETLPFYLKQDSPFPTTDTANDTKKTHVSDCVFHQWAWEGFVWATALGSNGIPRFMELSTPEELLSGAGNKGTRQLKLAARSLSVSGTPGFAEGAGAIVEADGNILVAPNGYPVYASVHMNKSYFDTAKKNLIVNGGYTSQPPDSYFDLGAAVFKATWLRLDPEQKPPLGAYTTQARVPTLTVWRTKNNFTVVPSGQFATATVALVGLHVVGYTENHPEFLWATFEHHLNSPRTDDNLFTTTGSNTKNYTFYGSNTPYAQVNQPNPPQTGQPYIPPQLTFDLQPLRFSPANNVVLENKTGGENFSTNGPTNISNVNMSGQRFLTGLKSPQSVFANYDLIGTVWLEANTYVGTSSVVLNVGASNAIGSVNLANSTAETFEQYPTNGSSTNVQNCFMCHNPTGSNLPDIFPVRRISISHVLEEGSKYAVPNLITVPIKLLKGVAPQVTIKSATIQCTVSGTVSSAVTGVTIDFKPSSGSVVRLVTNQIPKDGTYQWTGPVPGYPLIPSGSSVIVTVNRGVSASAPLPMSN